MRLRTTRWLLGGMLVLALAGCGVSPQREPEPLPPTTPAVLPPTVTQEPSPTPSAPPRVPTPTPVRTHP